MVTSSSVDSRIAHRPAKRDAVICELIDAPDFARVWMRTRRGAGGTIRAPLVSATILFDRETVTIGPRANAGTVTGRLRRAQFSTSRRSPGQTLTSPSVPARPWEGSSSAAPAAAWVRPGDGGDRGLQRVEPFVDARQPGA